MTRRHSALMGVALMLLAPAGLSCPCRGGSSPGMSVAKQNQRWGVNAIQAIQFTQGVWDIDGNYRALNDGELNAAAVWSLAVGVRPVSKVELIALGSFGRSLASSKVFAASGVGLGDMNVRLRWDALAEPLPFTRDTNYRPGLSFSTAVRLPVGTVERAGGPSVGGVGATATSEGLGTTELSAAVDAQRTLSDVQLNFVAEGGYRFADSSLGLQRQLGPRALLQLSARYLFDTTWTAGGVTDVGWEGDVALDDMLRPGTGQRLWRVGAFGMTRLGSGLSAGISLSWAPPVSGVGLNSLSVLGVSSWIGLAG